MILPEERFFKPMTVKGAQLIRNWPVLMAPLAGVTKLIGIAPVKDHHRSGASMAMKNWYGLLGGRRNIFHQDIQTIIAELATMVRPTLVVLDGTTTMMTNGPTGGSLADLKETRTLMVGTDQVAVDAFGATLLGKTAADLPFIAKAEALGAGHGRLPLAGAGRGVRMSDRTARRISQVFFVLLLVWFCVVVDPGRPALAAAGLAGQLAPRARPAGGDRDPALDAHALRRPAVGTCDGRAHARSGARLLRLGLSVRRDAPVRGLAGPAPAKNWPSSWRRTASARRRQFKYYILAFFLTAAILLPGDWLSSGRC